MNAPENETGLKSLSQREIEILGLISDGLSNRAIAEKLFLAVNTVKWYNRQIFMKLGVSSRGQAISLAHQLSQSEKNASLPSKAEIGPPHNLPHPLTGFVGREREIGQIESMLGEPACRVATVFGPGGIGKTRLAIQVALRLLNQAAGTFPDGVFFVPLLSLSEDGIHPPGSLIRHRP